ncbi:hypothetical protein ACOSP7_019696 [Xanthoceras sorbifolium]
MAGRERHREEDLVATFSPCPLLPCSSAPRALHASTGRAQFLALLTGRCSLLHRELHRELGLVAVELAVLTGWHGRLHREERRGAVHGAFLFFSFFRLQNGAVLAPKGWCKTASFHLSENP